MILNNNNVFGTTPSQNWVGLHSILMETFSIFTEGIFDSFDSLFALERLNNIEQNYNEK